MMWGGGYGMGGGGVLWLVVILAALALIVVGVVLLLRGREGRRDYGVPGLPPASVGSSNLVEPTALQILERRYARGDIDREEFLKRKADLSS